MTDSAPSQNGRTDASERTPLVRAVAAFRSGLRRYPGHLLASLRGAHLPWAEHERSLLEELTPHELAVSWLGHASVLMTAGEMTLVVDPVLSHRIGPRVSRRVIGLERHAPAPAPPGALRGVDAVLITHAHFDHLDRPTLEAMADERTTVVVPTKCAKLVPPGFGAVVEVEPEQVLEVHGAQIVVHTPRHWGARTVLDQGRGFCAYEVRHDAGAVLFAGDTAYTEAFAGLRAIDLAVFGIGAYEPWEHMHATPEQVWRMFTSMGARRLLPVHHSTFDLSDEPHTEPLERLYAAAGEETWAIVEAGLGRVVDVGVGK